MTDIAVFGFDKKIAKQLGVEEAILHEWIRQNCLITQETKRKQYIIEGKSWFPLTEEVAIAVFPFWHKDKIARMIERLKNHEYIEVSPSGIAVYAKVPPPKKKRKPTVLEKSESIEYRYHKVVDGMVVEVVEPAAVVVNYLIDQFQYVNPNYGSFFGIPVYRKAMLRMLKNYRDNPDLLLELLRRIPATNQQKYAPTITTPLEFERLAPKLIAWLQKEEGSKNSSMLL